jgi:hypothetical protein
LPEIIEELNEGSPMDLPIEIITLDSLMKRWTMSFNDIFLIVLNQDLTPVYSTYPDADWKKYGGDPEHDIIDVFLQNDKDPSRIVFLRSDVRQLEENCGGQVSKSKAVLNEKDIIERWGISKIELWNLQEECSLPVVDPLGMEFEDYSTLELHLMSYPKYNKLGFYFRLSDIERIEKEYGLKSTRKDDTESDTPDIDEDTKKNDDVPVISFYKNGEIWKIGKSGKEQDLIHRKGYDIIRFLIEHETMEIGVFKLDDLGMMPISDEKFDKSFLKENPKKFEEGKEGFSGQEKIDETTITECRTEIENLKELQKDETDSLVKAKIQEKIDEIQKYLNAAIKSKKALKFRLQRDENCRTNVRKRIKTALDIIERKIPYMKDYLNHETIKTGYKCSYEQDGSKPIKWKLNPPK